MDRIVVPTIGDNTTVTFGMKGDCLGRKTFGEDLMKLVADNRGPLVLSLNSPWGEGKTTFLRMWMELLNENEIKTIYVDAFKHAYSDDPFSVLVGALLDSAKELVGEDKSLLETIQEKAGKVGAKLLPLVAKLAVKSVTLGLVGESEMKSLESIKDDLAEESSKATEKFISDRIGKYSEEENAVEDLKKELEKLVKKTAGKENKPLVFIVDELDRCKPTFALSLLERIKHILSVDGITFVLSYHQEQMEEIIKHTYGKGVSACDYLTKFVHVRFDLPKRKKMQPIATMRDMVIYCSVNMTSNAQ